MVIVVSAMHGQFFMKTVMATYSCGMYVRIYIYDLLFYDSSLGYKLCYVVLIFFIVFLVPSTHQLSNSHRNFFIYLCLCQYLFYLLRHLFSFLFIYRDSSSEVTYHSLQNWLGEVNKVNNVLLIG